MTRVTFFQSPIRRFFHHNVPGDHTLHLERYLWLDRLRMLLAATRFQRLRLTYHVFPFFLSKSLTAIFLTFHQAGSILPRNIVQSKFRVRYFSLSFALVFFVFVGVLLVDLVSGCFAEMECRCVDKVEEYRVRGGL